MFDTQQNEAMNTSITKYAPKRKTYVMTISFTNRVMIAIGISNLGAQLFWYNVYSVLSISTQNYLLPQVARPVASLS